MTDTNIGLLALGIGILLLIIVVLWLVISSRKNRKAKKKAALPQHQAAVTSLNKAYSDIAAEDALHLFNAEFREELRNRGRLRFEKIIDENAAFLKQDLDATTAQLNEYMKQQITARLDQEFSNYAKAMHDAQTLALSSLQKTAEEIEQQRQAFGTAIKQEMAVREEALVKVYEENMSKIVEHYVLQVMGDKFDLKSQMPAIIKDMEANKDAILKDMRL